MKSEVDHNSVEPINPVGPMVRTQPEGPRVTEPVSPSPPHRLQFSLRAMLLLIGIVSACCGWVMHERRHIEQRRVTLNQLGAFFHVEEQPIWRLWLFGDDTPRFARKFLSLELEQDRSLKYLAELDQLQLVLAGQRITDTSLSHVSDPIPIKSLALINCSISDAGLGYLSNFPKLEILWLHRNEISDAGLAPLVKLNQMKLLQIDGSKISDRGESELRQALPNCQISRDTFGRSSMPPEIAIVMKKPELKPTEAKK